jgi:hypothetical protein
MRYAGPLVETCSHDAVFAIADLRTTQAYEWARGQPGLFDDPSWVNHEDPARYCFQAYDDSAAGDPAAVREAWRIAFTAAAGHQVSAAGDLPLGISAHVNRDLPCVLAAIGITHADGTTRKPDHDVVDRLLFEELPPLLAELRARFDGEPGSTPAIPSGLGPTAFFPVLAAWRELARHNAEALTDAPYAASRAVVARSIEAAATLQAPLIVAATGYLPRFRTAPEGYVLRGSPAERGSGRYPWGFPRRTTAAERGEARRRRRRSRGGPPTCPRPRTSSWPCEASRTTAASVPEPQVPLPPARIVRAARGACRPHARSACPGRRRAG